MSAFNLGDIVYCRVGTTRRQYGRVHPCPEGQRDRDSVTWAKWGRIVNNIEEPDYHNIDLSRRVWFNYTHECTLYQPMVKEYSVDQEPIDDEETL